MKTVFPLVSSDGKKTGENQNRNHIPKLTSCFCFLQVFSQLRSVLCDASVSLHLVEVSPALSRLQAQNLTGNSSQEADTEDDPVYRRGKTATGLPVSWYRHLDDVPAGTRTRFTVCKQEVDV